MNQSRHPSDSDMAAKARAVLSSQKRRGRFGLFAWIAIALVGLLLLLWLIWPKTETTEWETHVVDRGDMVLRVTASGNLEPRREVTVGAEVSGLLAEIHVMENDQVQVGDVLARFDTEELEVNLAQAEARLELARASLAEAEATLEETTVDQRRLINLRERNLSSQADLDAARAALMRATARVQYANASVREAEASLSASRTRLEKAVITSPVNGVVLKRNVEPGNTVAASFQAPELFILAEDLREMELHVSLDEADVGLVQPGQSASFTVDAWPGREFSAEVLRVYLYPNIENNVVTYTTILGVENPRLELLPGMTATATITTGTHEQIIRVPSMAFRFQPPSSDEGGGGSFIMMGPSRSWGGGPKNGNTVWRLKGEELERVPVRTGHSDGRFTEITSDELNEGEVIVVGIKRKKA